MQDQDIDAAQEDVFASFREERLEQRKKKPAILIGVSIGILIAVAIGWGTFGKYVSVYYNADSADLPVIRADASADGMRPETPGGMEVPNRDKLVYERLRQSNTELPVERLLPAVEKPLKPEPEEKKEEKPQDEIGVLAADIIRQEEPKQASALLYEEDGTPVEVMFKEAPAEEKPVAKAIKPEMPQKEKAEKEQLEPVEQKVLYSVQLVSTRSESAAESEWKRLSKKFKEIIANQSHMISKTVVSSGTFYRLRVGSFEKREDAAALCDQLKTKKQECFVVK